MDTVPPQKPSINSWSPEYLESQYQAWKNNPSSVDERWRLFFEGFELGSAGSIEAAPAAVSAGPSRQVNWGPIESQARVNSLVYHYRDVGHLMAKLDPLGRERVRPENLELSSFELTEENLDQEYRTAIFGIEEPAKLRDIIAYLEKIYCQHVGAEYMHIQSTRERRWIQERLEDQSMIPSLSANEKHNLLRKLHQAEIFENFLHTRYVGQKRFSLEGAETLIPILWYALEAFADLETEEVVFGMAHRGRLNVLANIINKAYDDIFAEFQDNYLDLNDGGGDVKYHKGYSSKMMTTKGKLLALTLAANPSHLEAVNPVVEGRTRAKQRLREDAQRKHVVPILIHGDAAFAGQGIIYEVLQMVKLPGFTTGGTLHIIVNNQIGFTTSPESARSSVYCTDVVKTLQAPIFHVNCEDVDACARVVRLAAEYRQTFNKDVVIDMWCYRKYGHNEGDEPAFTQPIMYETIKRKESIRTIYAKQLQDQGIIDQQEVEEMQRDLEEVLDSAQKHGQEVKVKKNQSAFQSRWDGFRSSYSFDVVDTTVKAEVLREIAERTAVVPEGFTPHRKVKAIYEKRHQAVMKDEPMDWGTVEMLAFGSLLYEKHAVRLTGQDSRRGTFSHRHAVLTDIKTEASYTPLNYIHDKQARFCIYDSHLSEAAVVGYEYGYSLSDPDMLIIWEAQFGDFANGAQVIIDQFITSSEMKWDRSSGLVMLLPHGYEGQGPEHSSARLERFLQLCAEDNIQVIYPTTPAQLFHALRRQIRRRFRKPLIVMSPKSLLRHPKVVSTMKDLTDGGFHEFIDDAAVENRQNIKRVLLCSGKVYYDLLERREENGNSDTAVIRVEQIYPLHTEMLSLLLARYPENVDIYWCQEEPKNMGAYMFISHALRETLNLSIGYIGRPAASSPAVGSKKAHDLQLEELLSEAIPSSKVVNVSAG